MVAVLIVLLSVIIWLLITTRSTNSDLKLVDDIQTNFLERTSLRDQYFLYHEELIRIRWEENKKVSDSLLRQAGLQFRDKETLQIVGELVRNIDDTSAIFHRIVANSNATKSAGGNREILEELDKRLSSQLLLKATLIRDTIFLLKSSALKSVQQRNLQLTVTILLLAGSLSMGIIFWNILLKQEVKAKTEYLEKEITERKKADEQIRTSLREKEILLKEIHHRVKNNLQIISSLLKLQNRFNPDERLNAVFQECQDRIRAMAGVHALLYRSKDFTRINFGDCIRETTAELLRSYQKTPANILPDIHAEEVMLSIDEAIPCSLIINELVTNAVKYAFMETGQGVIRIELTETEQGLRLLVKDNGVGFPPELNFRETKTLGLQLVNMLVKQLDGTIEQSVDCGTEYAILFVQKNISVEVPDGRGADYGASHRLRV